MTIQVRINGIRELQKALGKAKSRLPAELSIAINKTAKWTATKMSQQVRRELKAKAAEVKKVIRPRYRANAQKLQSVVRLDHEKRLPLKAFSPRQTKKGVTAKVSPKRPRTFVPGAFMGPKPGVVASRLGGHVFKRTGKARKPITKLYGASPWGAYVVNKMESETLLEANKKLNQEVARRTQLRVLRNAGLIKSGRR